MTAARPTASRAAALACTVALALGALVGCGGTDDDGTDQDESAAESSATEAASAEPTSGYLPVPAGVELTEPGTTLGLGDGATVAWRPRQDTVVALDLTVERIDRTSYKESFEGWVVTKQMRGQVPYFVRVKATNVGEQPAEALLVPLYGFTAASTMYEPLDFRQEVFEPCPGGTLPKRLEPGRSADLCFVYLLPEDQELASAAFDPVGELLPITWSGPITKIEKPKKDRGKKGRGKKDRGKKDKKGEKAG